VDAERRRDGADFPVLAGIQPPDFGVLLGADHGVYLGTRDGSAYDGGKCQALFPAADHAAQRARQGRSRHGLRRRVRRQCGERDGALGSLIPHAGAVRALVVAMIGAAFATAAVTLARGAD
jgi:hypothetical protein